MAVTRYDISEDTRYEIEVYNVNEIAEGTAKPVKAGVYGENDLPPIEKIVAAVKHKGYDAFEIHEITTLVSQYTVD